MDRIKDVQSHLQKEKLDGWLLYDFAGMNPLARNFLQIDPEMLVTRRFFYWIPAKGEPIKIQHVIEPHVLAGLPGKDMKYLKWQELEESLGKVLKGSKKIAMEYSPRCAIPYLSKVDAGMVDLVRSFHVEVVSSGSFLQYYTCVLDDEQLEMHLEAAQLLDRTANNAWEMLSDALRKGVQIDEYTLSQWIWKQIDSNGFMMEARPICGVNAHSADPHYEPPKKGSSLIRKGDFVLIDLWCKKKHPRAVYGDITRVAFAGSDIPKKHQEVFSIVRKAQKPPPTLSSPVIRKKNRSKGMKWMRYAEK